MQFKLKMLCGAGVIAVASATMALFAAQGNTATTFESGLSSGVPLAKAAPQVMELAQATTPASTLPGGASALNETYQDWQVACSQLGTAKRCVLSQSQVQQNGKRVLAIELGAPDGTALNGIIVMPFGLALASGATLQIDDKAAGQSLPFRTCLPVGCVVPVNFDASTISVLRAGVALKVTATSDDGQQTPFSISLKGFAAALDRVAALAG